MQGCLNFGFYWPPKFRVPNVSGNHRNQGKLEGIFPDREKSGNLAFFQFLLIIIDNAVQGI